MSWIILVVLGLAAVVLVFSLFKKLIKLAFTALALLLLVAGIWYLWQQGDVEVPEPVRQAGERAADRLGEVAGEALDKATEVAKERAEQAIDRAADAAKESAGEAIEGAPAATGESAGVDAGGENPEPAGDATDGDP